MVAEVLVIIIIVYEAACRIIIRRAFGPGRVRACNIALGFGLWVLYEALFSRDGGCPGAPWRGFFATLVPRRTPSESAEAPGTSPSHPLEPRFSLVFQFFPGSWKPEPAPDVQTSSPNLSETIFSFLGALKINFYLSRPMKIDTLSPGVTSDPST